ncbi:CubicO group peptidase (beta-lactamase class C family) [Novosphingobium chloroacetimidivorans]|uniref:CubicO group peptidase (Beta-lactamase class C family) n=1 Tax=Novosphingobium chloroacetimidivorans TaxID=1428314 RepID=A0A7W7K910_9SPHN|nr:serine hydrolase [Novosphingobium chloroacetimidivorans]MBB4857748.1 CubicO group peptidase (beta-lactamase class C family) [Novosphingobium chloroacetimidivorans]
MSPRRLPLIRALTLLPAPLLALAACGGGQDGPPPPSAEAQAAVRDDGGAARIPLARAIDGLFDADAVGATQALVVMKRGSVIAERYGSGIDAKTPLPGWSMAQCVTALMIGQLASDGRLRMDETAPVPDWQRPGDPRGEITLRQLLQMRSGLRHTETAQNANGSERPSDRTRMLFLDGRDDMAAYAEAQPLEAPAGRRFEPSAATGVILADLAGRVLTDSRDPALRRRAVSDYLRTRVLDPVGMKGTQVTFDRAGTLVGSSMMLSPARSWAMLGEFLRHTGSVKGAQVLPHRWVTFMRTASPRNPAYGAGVWLNGTPPSGKAPLWPGQGRKGLFACLGEHGQYLVGSPDQLLTVVRLGHSTPEQEATLHDRLGELIELFPG